MQKRTKRRVKGTAKAFGMAFLTAAFSFSIYLSVENFGQARYNQAVKDSYMIFSKLARDKQDPCRKASVRGFTLESENIVH